VPIGLSSAILLRNIHVVVSRRTQRFTLTASEAFATQSTNAAQLAASRNSVQVILTFSPASNCHAPCLLRPYPTTETCTQHELADECWGRRRSHIRHFESHTAPRNRSNLRPTELLSKPDCSNQNSEPAGQSLHASQAAMRGPRYAIAAPYRAIARRPPKGPAYAPLARR